MKYGNGSSSEALVSEESNDIKNTSSETVGGVSEEFFWRAIGSVADGAIHIRQEKPCQDALFFSCEKNFSIACVADGHGSNSCPYSADGALTAVKIAAEILAQTLDIAALKDIRLPRLIESKWKEAVEKIHAEKEREENFAHILYGTTLLAAAATEKFIFVLQIGDGNILTVDENAAHPILPAEENVGEETESLCLENAWTFIRTQIIPLDAQKPAMILLSTDGYAKSFADSAGFLKAGTDFFKLWQENGLDFIEKNLHDWLRNTSDKGSGDDIAMVLLFFEAVSPRSSVASPPLAD